MIETIEFKGKLYPAFQADGFASKFCFPFAELLCKGKGVDVGCNREEWKFEGAIAADPNIEGCPYDAFNLPDELDYLFSSHVLEHLNHFSEALNYWHTRLKSGGVLFLYLPDMDKQEYWRMWHNKKHVSHLSPNIMTMYFGDHLHLWTKVMVSGTDLNHSFYCIAEKI